MHTQHQFTKQQWSNKMAAQNRKVWISEMIRVHTGYWFDTSFGDEYDYLLSEHLKQKIKDDKATQEEIYKYNSMLDRAIQLHIDYNNFKLIDKSILPKLLYVKNIKPDIKFPCIFSIINGFYIMTEPCAEILQRFRLGKTQITPVTLWDLTLDKRANDQTYYFLNIAEWQQYFNPEASSERIRPANVPANHPHFGQYLTVDGKNDVDYAVSEAALHADVDMWHDPSLRDSIFMSHELKQALCKAKMGTKWHFISCKLVKTIQ